MELTLGLSQDENSSKFSTSASLRDSDFPPNQRLKPRQIDFIYKA